MTHKTRKALRRRRRLHGGNQEKDAARCQCAESNGKQCEKPAVGETPFCKNHKQCSLGPTSGFEPSFEQQKEYNDPAVRLIHNCFSYGFGVVDPKLVNKCKEKKLKDCRVHFHQPGALHGERNALNVGERRTCPVVEKLMIADIPSVTRTDFAAKCPPNTSKIALVVDKGEDYHFYRQDPDGMWSHKDGSNKVKRYDALKKPIANPQLASRNYEWTGSDLNYEDFCGFYCVPRTDDVELAPGEPIDSSGGGSRPGLSWRDHRTRSAQRKAQRRQRRQTRRS